MHIEFEKLAPLLAVLIMAQWNLKDDFHHAIKV